MENSEEQLNVQNPSGTTLATIDNPNRKTIKVWSEKLQRYYYKARDPNYYNEYFHKNKREMTCDICGKIVTCQMYSHRKSKKCMAKGLALEAERTVD